MGDNHIIHSELYKFGFTQLEILNCTESILRLYSNKSIDLSIAISLVAISLRTFTSLDCSSVVDKLISTNIEKVQKALPYVAAVACISGLSFDETISMIESSPTNDYSYLRSTLLDQSNIHEHLNKP